MARYPADSAHADAFTASRTRMEEMLAHLSDPVLMACTQEKLKDYVTVGGRELLRQVMQDQLDARAVAEERRREVTGADGVVRTPAERGHRRWLATTVGRVEVSRIAYQAPKAANLHVADTVLSLPAHLYSRPSQRGRPRGGHRLPAGGRPGAGARDRAQDRYPAADGDLRAGCHRHQRVLHGPGGCRGRLCSRVSPG
ncbi:hypothetical protein [Streptomyces sp. NPDC047009]|uniref:hypothetical protein n=1 Tax=unclassified Streptomyces TaxID=2593676 RepID=UPI0033E1D4D6